MQEKRPFQIASAEVQIALVKIRGPHGLIEVTCESVAEKKCNVRSEGKWSIANKIVDPKKMKNFLLEVTGIAGDVIDLSSDLPEKKKSLLTEYGLSDEQRASNDIPFIELTLMDGKSSLTSRFTQWFGIDYPIGEKVFTGITEDGKMNEQKILLISNQFKSLIFGVSVVDFLLK